MSSELVIKVSIADDHKIFRDGIRMALKDKEYLRILWEAEDGKDLMHKMQLKKPDVLLMDIRMPEVDGVNAIGMLRKEYDDVKIIVLTMYDDQEMITKMMKTGYYYTHNTTGRLINLFRKSEDHSMLMKSMLSETEMDFLRWTCTDLTYKEIASEMKINVRTVDNLRDNLFAKLEVKNRVGLVMYSIRNGIKTF